MTQPAPKPLISETDNDRLQARLEDARADLQRHATALSKLQSQFMASRLEVEAVHANLRAAQAHIDELRAHATNLEAEIARQHAAYAALEAAHAALNNTVDNMRASRSWRIAAPLRAASTLLRRGQRN